MTASTDNARPPSAVRGSAVPDADGTDKTHRDWQAEAQSGITLYEALAIARRTVSELTELPIDGIAASGRHAEGGWRVVIEVVESAARMGENDLLSSHEVLLSPQGELGGFSRLRRYHREDRDPS